MTIDVPALKRLWQQAFGDTEEFIDGFFRSGFRPERCRCIYRGDALAAALYWFDCRWNEKKLAYIYAVATDEGFRRQGLCWELMTDTHSRLKSLGYAGAVLVPGDSGLFSMYEKMGYRGFCPMERKTVLPAGEPAQLRTVGCEAYGKLRQSCLPENAVAHTEDALRFAAGFLDFYTDGECLFCGAAEKDTFYFQEFLGSPEKLPGILKALGAQKGTVRLPGGKSFAMYRSLTEDISMPSYFGIALD